MKSTNLTKSDILHIANISNLKLTEKEIEKFLPQLSKIVEYVGLLDEVDTKNVLPTYQVTGLKNVFREDVVDVQNTLSQDNALLNTNNTHNGLFKVKAILQERTTK